MQMKWQFIVAHQVRRVDLDFIAVLSDCLERLHSVPNHQKDDILSGKRAKRVRRLQPL